MAEEFRFDDLDLRIEPETRHVQGSDAITEQSLNCTRTAFCTNGCCGTTDVC